MPLSRETAFPLPRRPPFETETFPGNHKNFLTVFEGFCMVRDTLSCQRHNRFTVWICLGGISVYRFAAHARPVSMFPSGTARHRIRLSQKEN
jgi:hypothetical protein